MLAGVKSPRSHLFGLFRSSTLRGAAEHLGGDRLAMQHQDFLDAWWMRGSPCRGFSAQPNRVESRYGRGGCRLASASDADGSVFSLGKDHVRRRVIPTDYRRPFIRRPGIRLRSSCSPGSAASREREGRWPTKLSPACREIVGRPGPAV